MASRTESTTPGSRSVDMDLDVVIVGAGISGINAAYRIQNEAPPGTTYAILEGRSSMGGTWDLFRYPGIRSDSDIYTFGFPWRAWNHRKSMASGDQIKDYLIESSRCAGIDQHIRYRHTVTSADWRSADSRWELSVRVADQKNPVAVRARFILLGTGYYDYKTPLQAVIPGIESFQGKVIHPQFWPKDYDYSGKDVVLIGSGATAVTILPSIADRVKRVTMLQRSPGYIFSLPSDSLLAAVLFAVLPVSVAYFLNRLVWLLRSYFSTLFCKTFPGLARALIRSVTIKQLPPDISWDPHFNPRYNPWDQRFCACMNGDFFAALRSGKANIVTDKIVRVTEKSIELESGAALQPDVIVTATGLRLKFGGGVRFSVDGQQLDMGDKFAWKSAMLQDVPNIVFLSGYENASWTLGADVSARIFIRLLRLMEQRGATAAIPRVPGTASMKERPMMSLTSTYIKTANRVLPKGGEGQWSPKTNYFADMAGARWGDMLTDMEFH